MQKAATAEAGYNERLFSGGWRTKFHLMRFRWFVDRVRRYRCASDRVLELGCFDGKLIDFLPHAPVQYAGFDANWEGGLDLARHRWGTHPEYQFMAATSPQAINLADATRFDMAVIMETLEHVPPPMVDGYLRRIANYLDGWLFVTVPNEKGPLFLAKWSLRKIIWGDEWRYSPLEVVNATLGRLHRVERREHKGFDYARLIDEVARHFDIVEVSGMPFGWMPTLLCPGIGIVARTRR